MIFPFSVNYVRNLRHHSVSSSETFYVTYHRMMTYVTYRYTKGKIIVRTKNIYCTVLNKVHTYYTVQVYIYLCITQSRNVHIDNTLQNNLSVKLCKCSLSVKYCRKMIDSFVTCIINMGIIDLILDTVGTQ